LVCLLFTIAGGVLYQQSVTGPGNAPVQPKQLDIENSKLGSIGGGDGSDDDLAGESDGMGKLISR